MVKIGFQIRYLRKSFDKARRTNFKPPNLLSINYVDYRQFFCWDSNLAKFKDLSKYFGNNSLLFSCGTFLYELFILYIDEVTTVCPKPWMQKQSKIMVRNVVFFFHSAKTQQLTILFPYFWNLNKYLNHFCTYVSHDGNKYINS